MSKRPIAKPARQPPKAARAVVKQADGDTMQQAKWKVRDTSITPNREVARRQPEAPITPPTLVSNQYAALSDQLLGDVDKDVVMDTDGQESGQIATPPTEVTTQQNTESDLPTGDPDASRQRAHSLTGTAGTSYMGIKLTSPYRSR